jgi:hypothetical protein
MGDIRRGELFRPQHYKIQLKFHLQQLQTAKPILREEIHNERTAKQIPQNVPQLNIQEIPNRQQKRKHGRNRRDTKRTTERT